MVTKPSIRKTFRKVRDSLKPGSRPKLNPDMVKTGPLTKNLRLKKKPKLNLKNKIPKVSDLLYRPKKDKDGKIIKPKVSDLLYRPKYDSKGNIIKPKAVPMSKRKPKKNKKWVTENY